MPESPLRTQRAVALAVVATVVGVSAVVALSGQTTTAHAATAPGSTVRASVADASAPDGEDGTESGGENQELSANGTTVVFSSEARLDALSNDGYEAVYVRDLRNNRTTMISRGQFTRPDPPTITTTTPTYVPPRLAGEPLLSLNGKRKQEEPRFGEVPPTRGSTEPTISEDGRYVAFVTRADNIVVEDDNTSRDLLVCDRDPDGDGEFDERRDDGSLSYRYFRVNEPQWEQGDGDVARIDSPRTPKLSDDATRIVWQDRAFVDDSDGYRQVVRTAPLTPAGPGEVAALGTTLGDLRPTAQRQPDVSADGRFVVLVADYVRREGGGEFYVDVPFHAVIRKDMSTGAVLRVDWDVNTTPDDVAPLSIDESVYLAAPAIAGDGGTIAFEAEAYENGCTSTSCWYSVADQPVVYVVRVQEDGTPVDSAIMSRDNDNEVVNGFSPALSGDGRFLAFVTDNANAHDGVDRPLGDSDSCRTFSESEGLKRADLPPPTEDRGRRVVCQVVVRDLVVDRQRLVDEEPRLPGTLASPGTSGDCAETLPEDATCGGDDDSPPYSSTAASLSRNGSTIAYDSWAADLVTEPVDDNAGVDVYVRTFRPDLRADPTPLEFGEVTIGETFDRVVRLDHVGFGPLVVTELTIDAPEFTVGAQTCTGTETVVLQQTGSCEVSVVFTPENAGERTGTLSVRLRDGREFTVPLRGTGVEEEEPPPDARFAAAPDPLAFGDRLLLSTAPAKAVTVTNTGGEDLTVTGVGVVSPLAPADYAIESDTCTDTPVPPGGTCEVAVTFSPRASGARAAVLRFTDDVPGGTPHLIGLTGTAAVPAIEVAPGVSPPGRVLAVTGSGFAPGKPVTVRMGAFAENATAVPGTDGRFTAMLLVLPKTAIGTYPVTATIDDTDPPIEAAKAVLIVAPSVSPADFVIRN
ncbi:choice-of-anchor D domain-containing protein [Actinophytocola sp. NPDC049390]|uniref:choice-of-anchor D domain-containing protein n=1 Tax=Actinophytocola sp. NPDC049390 TaxID=3363894 RepID=UPI0037B2D023